MKNRPILGGYLFYYAVFFMFFCSYIFLSSLSASRYSLSSIKPWFFRDLIIDISKFSLKSSSDNIYTTFFFKRLVILLLWQKPIVFILYGIKNFFARAFFEICVKCLFYAGSVRIVIFHA